MDKVKEILKDTDLNRRERDVLLDMLKNWGVVFLD